MSHYRQQVTRADESQPDIVKELRKADYSVWIVGRPVDLLVWHPRFGPGNFKMLECKTLSPTGKVKRAARGRREAQEAFVAQTGTKVVGTPEQALEALK